MVLRKSAGQVTSAFSSTWLSKAHKRWLVRRPVAKLKPNRGSRGTVAPNLFFYKHSFLFGIYKARAPRHLLYFYIRTYAKHQPRCHEKSSLKLVDVGASEASPLLSGGSWCLLGVVLCASPELPAWEAWSQGLCFACVWPCLGCQSSCVGCQSSCLGGQHPRTGG